MSIQKFTTEVGGKKLSVELGKMAEQANGAALVTYEGTTILATCVMAKSPRQGVNYFPLTVDYEEKLYAAGKIKGSRFIKREGRPTDEAILTARLIDRTLRPRFNQKIRQDIQVVVTVLSFDKENDPDILGVLASSIAISVSDIPWQGPVAAVRVGKINDQYILNPSYQSRQKSSLDLIVSGSDDKINMLEGQSNEIPEKDILEAIEFAQKNLKKLIDFQKEIIEKIKPQKIELDLEEPDADLIKKVKNFLNKENRLENAIYTKEKITRLNKLNQLKDELMDYLKREEEEEEEEEDLEKKLQNAQDIFEEEIDKIVHKNIIEKEQRPDGRKLDEIREMDCQVNLLPRTHGSGLFKRGATQALAIVTLGPPGDEQILDDMEMETKKRFMLHYNFPPYSVGEVGPFRGPGRREIGHGALAERALEKLIPPKEEFPYTIRVVSEILSSNGSSSMASVCSASLALMDAGVPIKTAAAGIAMGLMMNQKGDYKILTDIQGPEDHHGDMDLKIAGTKNGICSLQMDVKIEGVNLKILEDAFEQAKKARLEILEKMNQCIKEPNPDLSIYAPRIITLQINPDKIREVIGPGGKVINEIIAQTNVDIDIEDNGLIFITSQNKESAQQAMEWIKNISREIKVGEIFQGKVTRIFAFGAMVEILPGQEGLIHISELAPYRVKRVEDVVKIGDIIPVKVKNIDEQGRINLTLKNLKIKR